MTGRRQIIRLPKVRLGGRVIEKNIRFGTRRSKRRRRLMFFPLQKGNKRHVTLTEHRQHLEVHHTDTATGAHTPVLDIDIYWMATRVSEAAFLDEFRRRWIERSFQVPSARELRAIGTKALMLVPTDNKSLLPDGDGIVDCPPFYSVAMRGLRHAAPGTTWAAFDAATNCLGLVWIARVSRKERAVLFTPWADVKGVLHWFLSELAGPSGTVPSFEEREVA